MSNIDLYTTLFPDRYTMGLWQLLADIAASHLSRFIPPVAILIRPMPRKRLSMYHAALASCIFAAFAIISLDGHQLPIDVLLPLARLSVLR